MKNLTHWPKEIPSLSPEAQIAREKWMTYWHEVLPNRFGIVEKFNHGFPAELPIQKGWKTLEIGAGLGEHLKWENTKDQDYYCFEYRKEWCERLQKLHPADRVFHGDIQQKQTQWTDGFFDRAIAIHVFEHLPDLPKALDEIGRLLKPNAVLDVVLPCEGGLAYHVARELTSRRMFEKQFPIPYRTIMAAEHINTYPEVIEVLENKGWKSTQTRYFPLGLPLWQTNLIVGLRFQKKHN